MPPLGPVSPYQARSYNIHIFLYETIIFYTKFYQNIHQNAGNMSQNFPDKLNTLYSKRADKIISFYIKMTFLNLF